MTEAITVEGLVKHFGEVRALDGVSFGVGAGSVLGLLGPNGAGKTTVVRILTTILQPDSGRATVAGHSVAADPQGVRRSIGLVGQYASVDENLTGRENLTLVGRLNHLSRAVARERAVTLLAQFSLTAAGGRPARTYSGGMRRRLDLAAALITGPPVLLLDEPTAGLDPSSRQDLWEMIETLVADGTTVLLTTQYLEEADRLANRVVVIDKGVVAAEGTPSELKAALGETTVALRFRTPHDARAASEHLTGFSASLSANDPLVVAVPLRGGAKTIREILNRLDEQGIDVGRLDVREPTLDDVFLNLTRPA